VVYRLESEKKELVMGTLEDQNLIIKPKEKKEANKLEEETLQVEIRILKENLAKTIVIIQALVNMITREDVSMKIKKGLIAERELV